MLACTVELPPVLLAQVVHVHIHTLYTVHTVNHEYFIVKYFQTAWLVRKLNAQEYMRNINDNAVQGYRMKYFRHEIFTNYGSFVSYILNHPPDCTVQLKANKNRSKLQL